MVTIVMVITIMVIRFMVIKAVTKFKLTVGIMVRVITD